MSDVVIPAGARQRVEPGPRGIEHHPIRRLGPGYFAKAKFRDDSCVDHPCDALRETEARS
jgi:hypothetical protein